MFGIRRVKEKGGERDPGSLFFLKGLAVGSSELLGPSMAQSG